MQTRATPTSRKLRQIPRKRIGWTNVRILCLTIPSSSRSSTGALFSPSYYYNIMLIDPYSDHLQRREKNPRQRTFPLLTPRHGHAVGPHSSCPSLTVLRLICLAFDVDRRSAKFSSTLSPPDANSLYASSLFERCVPISSSPEVSSKFTSGTFVYFHCTPHLPSAPIRAPLRHKRGPEMLVFQLFVSVFLFLIHTERN